MKNEEINVLKMIDHTLLKPDATRQQIKKSAMKPRTIISQAYA